MAIGMDTSNKLLTVAEVATMLGVSEAFVYQHANGARRPKIPCVKIGRALRFRRESIEAWLRELEKVA
jgi:excisionase family DNA binding protein